ncbi:hypothetical protein BT96DRAFT_434991 [Gymnopus androsaceus JB14]|uniref:Uncharacterized protein n=1 Tax=Gymnopus androsaceus JB14 TaxID=1447944 RepID=A0A6A4I1Q0_9AGAR|nr:hypothetical protein BT96DRAFT_434991 [Gymnopus androsaceus JB14]
MDHKTRSREREGFRPVSPEKVIISYELHQKIIAAQCQLSAQEHKMLAPETKLKAALERLTAAEDNGRVKAVKIEELEERIQDLLEVTEKEAFTKEEPAECVNREDW